MEDDLTYCKWKTNSILLLANIGKIKKSLSVTSVLCCLHAPFNYIMPCPVHKTLEKQLKSVLCCRYLIQSPQDIKHSDICHSVFDIIQVYFIIECECMSLHLCIWKFSQNVKLANKTKPYIAHKYLSSSEYPVLGCRF
jgi:hypothetical protein